MSLCLIASDKQTLNNMMWAWNQTESLLLYNCNCNYITVYKIQFDNTALSLPSALKGLGGLCYACPKICMHLGLLWEG